MTPTVESTYKAKEVEERIDILFYRPLGFRVAKLASGIGLSPNVITIVSIIFGMLGGHLFYYDDLRLTIAGMILWVCSNILDSADGQLARMTGQTSEIGRLLDGLGGGVVFGSIYLHIALRHIDDGGMFGVWVIAIALFAGIRSNSAPTCAKTSSAVAICSRVCAAEIDDRKRLSAPGVDGGIAILV